MKLKLKYILFYLLTIGGSGGLLSQTPTLDSLKTVLKNSKYDSTRCRILLNLVDNEYDGNLWPKYNEQIFKLSEKNISAGTESEKKIYLRYYAISINNKGLVFQEHGDISNALEQYFTALKIQEQIQDKYSMAITINNIAYIYMHQGDINKSLESVKKALKLQEEISDSASIAQSYNNLGNIYKNKNDITKSVEYFERSLLIYKIINNKDGIAICLSNIGDQYLNTDTEKAVDYFLQALKLNEELNNKSGIAYNLANLADAMLKLGKTNEALAYGLQSYDAAKELNYLENLKGAASTLYKIYKTQNNSAKALKMFEIYIQLYDSINNETTRKSSVKRQMQYEYEKKAAADSVKIVADKKLTSIRLEQEQNQRYYLYGGLLLTLIFGGVMFNRFRIAKKQKHIIEDQKTIVEHQKKLVEEKQKEVLDSIYYARRIQQSLLPTEKYLERIFKKYDN